ncbi:hypothetical protein [Heyndrickxia ginsengihumi]|uniref:hypothetical protein n=1 Tax=Heyndrickxia ginsengihumi TaxID=363870 RepID=UPI0004B7CA98|nr:hypothetical protein [Heyndrickxia ginsengihumi]
MERRLGFLISVYMSANIDFDTKTITKKDLISIENKIDDYQSKYENEEIKQDTLDRLERYVWVLETLGNEYSPTITSNYGIVTSRSNVITSGVENAAIERIQNLEYAKFIETQINTLNAEYRELIVMKFIQREKVSYIRKKSKLGRSTFYRKLDKALVVLGRRIAQALDELPDE